jgi:hypothetical protein
LPARLRQIMRAADADSPTADDQDVRLFFHNNQNRKFSLEMILVEFLGRGRLADDISAYLCLFIVCEGSSPKNLW